MASEYEQHPAHEQILRILELQRVTEENKKKAEELKAEIARIEQATADIKINPQGIETINLLVNSLKDLESMKVMLETQARNKPGQAELLADVERKMLEIKDMPGVKDALEGLRDILTREDINDVLDGDDRIDWYGLSGMPDLQPKAEQ